MFENAKSKLEDSRILFEKIQETTDARTFRTLFNSFLSSSRAITYALQKEGDQVSGFKPWYAGKQVEMRSDALLRFIHEARTEDFHEGAHQLIFSTYVERLVVNSPPVPNAAFVMGPEGAFWLVDQGTPRERRIPFREPGSYNTRIYLRNPPRTHQGKALKEKDPITICRLSLGYFSELVHEANSKFGSKR